MLRYIVRRVLFAVPTMLIISLITFGLSKCAAKDKLIDDSDGPDGGNSTQQEVTMRIRAAQLGLDKPAFYCTLTSAAFPDTLYRILPFSRREKLATMTVKNGNWAAVIQFDQATQALWGLALRLPDSLPHTAALRSDAAKLRGTTRVDTLDALFARFIQNSRNQPGLLRQLDTVRRRVEVLDTQFFTQKNWIPALYWHGFDNQYHHWLSGFVTGDLGITRGMRKKVADEIRPALICSMVINGLAMLLAYWIAVPLGVALARRREGGADRWTRRVLLFLHAMPGFWLGGLLILLIATPGMGFSWIHGITVQPLQDSGKSVPVWFLENAVKLILPVLTITLHMLAMLALQMRGGILEVMGQDYIRTARAKGADEKHVYWRHAFPNALFPLITVFAGVFPAIFAGSLVVESLFGFPGMGMKTQEAFQQSDYPLLFAILMLASFLTILGNLIADLLYAWTDPRVRFS